MFPHTPACKWMERKGNSFVQVYEQASGLFSCSRDLEVAQLDHRNLWKSFLKHLCMRTRHFQFSEEDFASPLVRWLSTRTTRISAVFAGVCAHVLPRVFCHRTCARTRAVLALRTSKDLIKDLMQSFPHLMLFRSYTSPIYGEDTLASFEVMLESRKNWLPRETLILLVTYFL